MEKEIYKVKPIIIYPICLENTGIQNDCYACDNKEKCIVYQPRCMCIKPYKNHKYGCPNFGRLSTCPPNIPSMYDQIFDISDVYAIVTKFNLSQYFQMRRERRPDLPEGQIRNLRAWQPIAIKENDYAIADFYNENPELSDYISTRFLECMGVDVINTMKEVGINIKFPVEEYAYRIAFAAKVYKETLDKYNFEISEVLTGSKKGIKTLVRKNK